MQKVALKIINLLLILGAIGLGLWLLNKNFPATGRLTVNAQLGEPTPMVSSLGPPPRLKFDYPHQLILENPVYFDVRAISWFSRARIVITYREEGRTLVGIAGSTGEGWQFHTYQPLLVTEDAGWLVAVFDVDLRALYHPKNSYRFLIDTEGDTGAILRLKSLTITLER